jgi:hypothetical protein
MYLHGMGKVKQNKDPKKNLKRTHVKLSKCRERQRIKIGVRENIYRAAG